jgi:hypothetical protein
MSSRLLLIAVLAFFVFPATAQEKSEYKFGKVNPGHFKETYPLAANENAIVLADIGKSQIVDNPKGGFSLEFKRYTRIKILNKNGYDVANIQIPLYSGTSAEEELENLKAVTYNLENDKVTETKLDKSAVFKDKINKHLIIKKFTFPNIHEGSIIELEYRILSDFLFNLQPWDFEGDYPCLWSEYNVSIPECYYYVKSSHGYLPFYINKESDRLAMITFVDGGGAGATERITTNLNYTDYRWVIKDIPALKEEGFTTSMRNHRTRIEFQLAGLRLPFTPRDIMGTWPQMTRALLKDDDFGYQIKRDNGWLNEVMPSVLKNATNEVEKAQNIYSYIRDNYTCTNYSSLYLDKPLKNLIRVRSGNDAELNLLLIAMLDKANISADPVILSTRTHGYVHTTYPLLNRFNYVIARVVINDKVYFLDASRPMLGFGKLDYNLYNGQARVVNDMAMRVEFSADSLLESSYSLLTISNDENGNMVGTMNKIPGYFESVEVRKSLKEDGKEKYFNEIRQKFDGNLEMDDKNIDSLDKYDQPVVIRFGFDIKHDKADMMYFNPMFTEAWKENPFKSAKRVYPIEMPYAQDEDYLMNLEIPAGYEISELPQSIRIKLNEQGDGFFEYLISEANGTISFRSHIKFKRALFQSEEYESLREFYNLILKKHSEQIVFKKKK